MKNDKPRLAAHDVVELLRARYPLPAYAFLEQVADGTGARQNRWADAVAMSVWPSRGYHLYGFEVKVSRSDWLTELRNPAKADAIMKYCHGWYLAVSDVAIVQPGELPATWGLMAVKGGKLTTITAAPVLTPHAFSSELFASLIRNVVATDASKVERTVREATEKAVEEAVERTNRNRADLRKSITEFEAASGIRINEYSGGKELGEAVNFILQMKSRVRNLQHTIRGAEQIVEGLKGLEALSEVAAIAEAFEET